MRILMLGNSFTYFHDMPKMLQAILGEEVVSRTKGGAFLSEQLDVSTELGEGTMKLLTEEKWDYVVMQEQSKAPIFARENFHASVKQICELARNAGAKPLLYASWAYREGSEKLASTELSYEEMSAGLYDSYHAAAESNHALIADVGLAFRDVRDIVELYCEDAFHPSPAGSVLAAATIAAVIRKDANKGE